MGGRLRSARPLWLMCGPPPFPQVFALPPSAKGGDTADAGGSSSSDSMVPRVFKLRFTFRGSTDFYGRVTVYRLEVWGTECDP